MGARLFDRTTRSVALTSTGAVFASHSDQVLSDLEHAATAVTDVAMVRKGSVAMPTCLIELARPCSVWASVALALSFSSSWRGCCGFGDRDDKASSRNRSGMRGSRGIGGATFSRV